MPHKIVEAFKKYWQAILFVAIILFFFYPFFSKGYVPVALDIPTGMYYPWLNDSFGFPVKVPVKNSLLTDTISQFWIWRNWAVEGLKSGEIKIWNPLSLAGYEMSPWFHTIVFSPFNIFYFLVDKVSAMSWVIISQVAVSLFGSFIFAKSLFKQKYVAVFFALTWSLSSYFVGWLTWGTVSHTLASLPLVLYFVISAQDKWLSRSSYFLYFLSFCFLLLSGHPQTIAYCLFIWASFVFVWSYKSKISGFVFNNFICLLLAIVFISPAIIPSIKVIFSSVRLDDTQLNSVNFGLVPISKVLALSLSPNYFGNHTTGNYFGGGYNLQEKLVYFGIIPLFFAVFAVFNEFYRKEKSRLFYLAIFLAIFGLAISSESILGEIIYKLKVPIISSSPAGRGLIIFIFGASLLSAHGLSVFLKNSFTKTSFFVTSVVVFFCFLFSFATVKLSFLVMDQASASMVQSYASLRLNYATLTRNLLLSFVIFTLFWSSLMISLINHKLRLMVLAVVLALTIIDSFMFFRKYIPFTPPHLYFPKTSSINFLESKLSPTQIFRIERQSGEVMPPNMWEPYGLQSLSGYDPMASKPYQSFLLGSKIIPNLGRYVELGEKLDQLNFLGVKYFMVIKRNAQGVIDDKGKLPYYVDTSKWQEVSTDGPISILENKNFTPPYKLSSSSGTVSLLNHTENSFLFKIHASKQDEFIFYQNTNSNWSAKVNGAVQTIAPESNTFIKLQVPKGESTIELKYNNRELILGWQLSAISLVLLIFVILKTKV